MFGADSRVDVGALVATTQAISDDDFMSGNYVSASDTASTTIISNAGQITAADGGFVVLSASQVPKDRKSVVEGQSVLVRVDLGGGQVLKKKTIDKTHEDEQRQSTDKAQEQE